MKKSIVFLLLLINLISLSSLSAQTQLSDSAKISLITTSPWSGAIYSVYGHTAIFVKDDATGVDRVYNYGYFNTDKPHFMYSFVRGETDYILGDLPFDIFIREYREKGLEVVEQELNLTLDEKQSLYQALRTNALPENREYRYNFLYDNCSTRPRDMVEKYTQNVIQYPKDNKVQTARELIHDCVNEYPWMKFGIDLVIGSGADKPLNLREKMFLPAYLMHNFDGAKVLRNDTIQPQLVKEKKIILQPVNTVVSKSESSWTSPISVAFALLILTLFISVAQIVKLHQSTFGKIYDTLLFGVAGIAGFIIFFLMYFSEHPIVAANWNFVWLNILSLVFAILFWVKSFRWGVNVYHFINFAALSLFLLLWWLIPQQLPLASIPFAISLWIRSGTNILVSRKRSIRNRKYPSSQYMKAAWNS